MVEDWKALSLTEQVVVQKAFDELDDNGFSYTDDKDRIDFNRLVDQSIDECFVDLSDEEIVCDTARIIRYIKKKMLTDLLCA